MKPSTITWILKPSKLCNLRCAYCYEWDELSNAARMSMHDLRTIFRAAREYHELVRSRFDAAPTTRFVLHGGEPLALPLDYLRELVALQGEAFVGAEMRRLVQTNLYRVAEEKLELLVESGFHIGVSVDVVPGVRRSLAGRQTESDVLRRLDRLREGYRDVSVISVVAKHTAPHLARIHDYFLARELALFVLPLQGGPASRPLQAVEMSGAELRAALERLFIHWFEQGCRLRLQPLQRFFEHVVRKMLGINGRMLDRRRDGDRVFVVNSDLGLYRINDAYGDDLCLGNLRTQSLTEILSSNQYERSLVRDGAVLARTCTGCRYAGPCSGSPVFEFASHEQGEARCGLPFELLARIEQHLRSEGVDQTDLQSLLPTRQSATL